MLNRPADQLLTKKGCLRYFLPVIGISLFCVYYADRPTTVFINKHLYGNSGWSKLTSHLPDILLIMVVVISSLSYILFMLRKYLNIYNFNTFLFKHIALALTISFALKSLLKIVFGRITTREWLQHPLQYGFHWFQGYSYFVGFPSGHMAVFTSLFAAIWRVYPRHKNILCFSLALLGALLIATNYHFLSDVISGLYLGLLVEAVLFDLMKQDWSKLTLELP